jgi:hypothetical protein
MRQRHPIEEVPRRPSDAVPAFSGRDKAFRVTSSIPRDPSGESLPTSADAEATARIAADRLAIALEEVGFDVGRDFADLGHRVDAGGAPVVNLGHVAASVATRLTGLLLRSEGSRCFGGEQWT